jgi:hypothetical protein
VIDRFYRIHIQQSMIADTSAQQMTAAEEVHRLQMRARRIRSEPYSRVIASLSNVPRKSRFLL